MKNILVSSTDPGGTDALIPVIIELKKHVNVIIIGAPDIISRYENTGLECLNIDSLLTEVTVDSLRALIRSMNINAVLTEAGGYSFKERFLWVAAKTENIPSYVILDNWVNYGLRFSNYTINDSEKFIVDPVIKYLPDYIFAMDSFAKNEMINEGIPEGTIIVSGQPFYQKKCCELKHISESDIKDYRSSVGCAENMQLVLYAPDDICGAYNEEEVGLYWGYNEYTILEELINVIDDIDPDGTSIVLVNRPHPKNKSDFWSKAKRKGGKAVIRDSKTSLDLAIMSADIIVGMFSSFLILAKMVGKQIISAQIGLKRENPFVLCRKGEIKCADSRVILKQLLSEAVDCGEKDRIEVPQTDSIHIIAERILKDVGIIA